MDHSLRDKIRDLLQELSGCYAFEAEDTAKSILSLIAEEVEYQRQGVGDDDWYDGWNAAIRNVLDLLGEIIVSNPPEAQAEGWQQEWECDVCGYLYKAPRPHGDNCIGTMHRIDRRKSDDSGERYTCQDCGAEMNAGEGRTFTCCDKCWSKRYPLKGEERGIGHCDKCGETVDAINGECSKCGSHISYIPLGPIVEQGEEKKG